MKTIITILLVIITSHIWSQNDSPSKSTTNTNSIYIFGDPEIQIEETDRGFHMEYEIDLNDPKSKVEPEKFAIYNTETIYFANRFINAYKTFSGQPDIDDKFKNKSDEVLEIEAQRIYTMLRLMTVNKENSEQPIAGNLIIEGQMMVQKLTHELDNSIQLQAKGWFKKLNADGYLQLQDIQIENKKVDDTIQVSLHKKTTFFYEINRQDSLKKRYKKGKYVELNKKLEDFDFSNIRKDSIRVYRSKYAVKNRLENILIDNFILNDEYELVKLSWQIEKQKQYITDNESQLDSTDKLLKTYNSDLENILSLKKDFDNATSTLLGDAKEIELIIILNSLEISKIQYLEFFNYSKDREAVDVYKYIESYQNAIRALSIKNNELEKSGFEMQLKLSELENDTSKTDLMIKQRNIEKIKNELHILDEKHVKIKAVSKEMEKLFYAKNQFLINLEKLGKEPEEIDSEKKKAEDSIKVFKKNIAELTEKVKVQKHLLDDYCDKFFTISRKQIQQQIEIDSIQIEFNDGKIENLIVIGSLTASAPDCDERKFKSLKFSNVIPYGFTSEKEIELLNKRWIYTDGGEGVYYKLNVGRLFAEYIEKLEVDRRDYSPRNDAITLKRDNKEFNPKKGKYYVELKKDYTHEILGGTVFTDLAGISGDEPNGLVQTEIYKELPLMTNRYQTGIRSRKAVNDFSLGAKRVSINLNFGILAYMKPLFVLSKIENENKALPLSSKEVSQNGITDSIFYASTLDLRRFENFRVGFDMNIGLIDIPELKSTIYLDYGLYWGRVKVKEMASDIEFTEYGVNVFEHGPRLAWELFTDERYGFRLGWSYNWYYARTNEFQQVGDPEMYSRSNLVEDQSLQPKRYWSTEILAFLKPNRDGRGKFFFRYRLNVKSKYWNQTWSQIQLGYAFSITKTTAPEPK